MFCKQCNSPVEIHNNFGYCVRCDQSFHLANTLRDPTIDIPPYVSVDLETTGLNPEYCQILEVGAIIDDGKTPVKDLPTFRRVLKHEQIVGEPFALQMNAALLREVAAEGDWSEEWIEPHNLSWALRTWFDKHQLPNSIQAAGKNFAAFDLQFLKKLVGIEWKHRVLDPAVLYWHQGEWLPDFKTCLERAGLGKQVPHNAVDDARLVVQLIRRGLSGGRR